MAVRKIASEILEHIPDTSKTLIEEYFSARRDIRKEQNYAKAFQEADHFLYNHDRASDAFALRRMVFEEVAEERKKFGNEYKTQMQMPSPLRCAVNISLAQHYDSLMAICSELIEETNDWKVRWPSSDELFSDALAGNSNRLINAVLNHDPELYAEEQFLSYCKTAIKNMIKSANEPRQTTTMYLPSEADTPHFIAAGGSGLSGSKLLEALAIYEPLPHHNEGLVFDIAKLEGLSQQVGHYAPIIMPFLTALNDVVIKEDGVDVDAFKEQFVTQRTKEKFDYLKEHPEEEQRYVEMRFSDFPEMTEDQVEKKLKAMRGKVLEQLNTGLRKFEEVIKREIAREDLPKSISSSIPNTDIIERGAPVEYPLPTTTHRDLLALRTRKNTPEGWHVPPENIDIDPPKESAEPRHDNKHTDPASNGAQHSKKPRNTKARNGHKADSTAQLVTMSDIETVLGGIIGKDSPITRQILAQLTPATNGRE